MTPRDVDSLAAQNVRNPKLFTTAEAAELMNVSVRTVQRMITARELAAIRIRRSIRISAIELAKIVEAGFGNEVD